jgi:hypothetical protein
MMCAKRILSDSESSLIERLSLGVSLLRIIVKCQVVEPDRSVRMFGAERLLRESERGSVANNFSGTICSGSVLADSPTSCIVENFCNRTIVIPPYH